MASIGLSMCACVQETKWTTLHAFLSTVCSTRSTDQHSSGEPEQSAMRAFDLFFWEILRAGSSERLVSSPSICSEYPLAAALRHDQNATCAIVTMLLT